MSGRATWLRKHKQKRPQKAPQLTFVFIAAVFLLFICCCCCCRRCCCCFCFHFRYRCCCCCLPMIIALFIYEIAVEQWSDKLLLPHSLHSLSLSLFASSGFSNGNGIPEACPRALPLSHSLCPTHSWNIWALARRRKITCEKICCKCWNYFARACKKLLTHSKWHQENHSSRERERDNNSASKQCIHSVSLKVKYGFMHLNKINK